jgi:hypothetical protein
VVDCDLETPGRRRKGWRVVLRGSLRGSDVDDRHSSLGYDLDGDWLSRWGWVSAATSWWDDDDEKMTMKTAVCRGGSLMVWAVNYPDGKY